MHMHQVSPEQVIFHPSHPEALQLAIRPSQTCVPIAAVRYVSMYVSMERLLLLATYLLP